MEIQRRTRTTIDPVRLTIMCSMVFAVILLGLSADAYFYGSEIQRRGFIHETEQDYIALAITAIIATGFILAIRRINNEKD